MINVCAISNDITFCIWQSTVKYATKKSRYESIWNTFIYPYQHQPRTVYSKLFLVEVTIRNEEATLLSKWRNESGGNSGISPLQIGWPDDVLHFPFLYNHDCPAHINIKKSSNIFQQILAHLYHPSLHHTTTISDWLLLG